MAHQAYEVTVSAHPTEFSEEARTLDIYFDIPASGINMTTGIFLIVHSLGEDPNSLFYRKLRADWADRYNVVTASLNYLGTKLELSLNDVYIPEDQMQILISLIPREKLPGCFKEKGVLDLDKVFKLFSGLDLTEKVHCIPNPTDIDYTQDYNDFGYIQALDCLTAVNSIMAIAEDNNQKIHLGRIFAYGVGHGGYVAMMTDKFAPSTFALVADNSGWIVPQLKIIYSDVMRKSFADGPIISLNKPMVYDALNDRPRSFTQDMFDIRSLDKYEHLKQMQPLHRGKYVFFHGELDRKVLPGEKRFLSQMMQELGFDLDFHLFGPQDIDGYMLNNVTHGLPGSWKVLFERFCDQYCMENSDKALCLAGENEFTRKDKTVYSTANGRFIIDFSGIAPVISYESWSRGASNNEIS
ncbi:MAG: hypothetical protein A4E53_00600 [Pelotomaculum sp. PtaB.Bin104]|nr:MAG: hypothetical protein A4E53_00600 [Pelotomaculum sp. PtaB.Bin104]